MEISTYSLNALNNFNTSSISNNDCDIQNIIDIFSEVKTIDEARMFLQILFPLSKYHSSFSVGNTNIIVADSLDRLRISLDSPKDFICYNFTLTEDVTNG